MKHSLNLPIAIDYAKRYLLNIGQVVKTENWQGLGNGVEMFSAMDFDFQVQVPQLGSVDERVEILREHIKPNLPWADVHFEERISGIPYNPPPSHEIWPFGGVEKNAKHIDKVFTHTYPERFWPKQAVNVPYNYEAAVKLSAPNNHGIRYELGDMHDLIELLIKEPNTRQAYLPIWFPEDTGAVHGGRVPCTLGYLFQQRNGYLHMTYYMRATDYLRHFRDDIYLAIKLLYHILEKLRQQSEYWANVQPGYFKFHTADLHVFAQEKGLLVR